MSKVATPKRDNASPAAGRGKPTSYGSPAHIRAPRCSGNDSPQAVSLGSGSPERSRRGEGVQKSARLLLVRLIGARDSSPTFHILCTDWILSCPLPLSFPQPCSRRQQQGLC